MTESKETRTLRNVLSAVRAAIDKIAVRDAMIAGLARDEADGLETLDVPGTTGGKATTTQKRPTVGKGLAA
jgi:hypothetical protein